jgi:hypothetical protein
MADNMSIDKKEPDREGSDDSMDSTPEAEAGVPPENAAQQKRKGGRKPVCFAQFLPHSVFTKNLDICYLRGT